MKVRLIVAMLVVGLIGLTGCDKEEEVLEQEAVQEQAPAEEEESAPEVAAAEAEEEAAEDDALGCEAVVTNTVQVLFGELGEESFFKEEDVPTLIEGCEKGDTLAEHPETVECLAGIKSLDEMEACADANDVVKAWAEAAT